MYVINQLNACHIGSRVFCSALRYYEFLDIDTLQIYTEIYEASVPHGDKVFSPIIFVLTSHWPFYEQFESILQSIHRNLESQQNIAYPIEKFFSNLVLGSILPNSSSHDFLINHSHTILPSFQIHLSVKNFHIVSSFKA